MAFIYEIFSHVLFQSKLNNLLNCDHNKMVRTVGTIESIPLETDICMHLHHIIFFNSRIIGKFKKSKSPEKYHVSKLPQK